MRQRRSRPGLTSQSLPAFRVLCKSTGQYFDGDLSTQSCIVGQIYDPHTAGAEPFRHAILVEVLSDERLRLAGRITHGERGRAVEHLVRLLVIGEE